MMSNNRWTNYGLWVAITSFIPLFLSSLGIEVVPNYPEIVNAFLAILVTAGILSNPTTTTKWFKDDSCLKSDDEKTEE